MLRRLLVSCLVLAACDTDDGRDLQEPTAEQRTAMTTTTSSTSTLPGGSTLPGAVLDTVAAAFTLQAPWADGGAIDARFTCDGEDLSPALTWTAPPAGTVELALVVSDDDADGFVHWAVAGIAPSAGSVTEGSPFPGGLEGVTGFGTPGWQGPCAPEAGSTHTYRFTMYALGQQTELPDDFTGDELVDLASSTAIGLAEVTGAYTRAG